MPKKIETKSKSTNLLRKIQTRPKFTEVSAYFLKAVDSEFFHHHWQLFDKHGVIGEVKIPPAQVDSYAEEEGIESNYVAWAGDCVSLLQTNETIFNVFTELPPEPETDLNELKSSTCIQLRYLPLDVIESIQLLLYIFKLCALLVNTVVCH